MDNNILHPARHLPVQKAGQGNVKGKQHYHLCGIGGSGMLPLALILHHRGYVVSGSDRSREQGRTPEKFSFIEKQGIRLFPQDGSGILEGLDALVVSAAVEENIPDVKEALAQGIPVIRRANLLANLFNQAETRVAVAGTSGKSTTTAMIGCILRQAGQDPTVMNGAVFRNFQTDENPFVTALTGQADLFVTEADESDGSIALYHPTIAVLNNIALDHKSMDELIGLFGDFVGLAPAAVLNLDNPPVAKIAATALREKKQLLTYSLNPAVNAALAAENIIMTSSGSRSRINHAESGTACDLTLQVPGRHNLANALAAIGTCLLLGVSISDSCQHLAKFLGVKRRMETLGEVNGITVIDDFAHNPDKIAATLATLRETPGRLLLFFQIHGYGPIRLMRQEFSEVFARFLTKEDHLIIPEVLYLGGTVDRSITAQDLVGDLINHGVNAIWLASRDEALPLLRKEARPGDRIVVMGARDDTLTDFARILLNHMSQKQ